jgi:hypothetical protein
VTSESCGGDRVKRFLYSDKLSGERETVMRGCEGRGVVERGQLPPEEPDSYEAGREVEAVSVEGRGGSG